jgi:DNA-binding transcriptional LysR family regulator
VERHSVPVGPAGPRFGRESHGSPTPHEFHAFVTLAENLHFGRAARKLGLAQSSLSEAIRRLEGKLELILFERTSRRVELTGEGQRLLPVAHEVLQAIAAAQAVTVRPSPSASDVFRIGIEVPGLAELTRPVLSRFRARHPDTPLVLREFSCAHGFFEMRLDAALVRTPVFDERLVVHPLATEPRVFILPPEHPAADAEQASLIDFQDEPFVALEDRAPVAREYWLALERRGGELPPIGAEVFTAREFCDAVVHLGALAIGLESARRLFPELVVVDAVDLPDNVIGLVVRADDTRPMVLDFVDVIPRLVSEYADLTSGLTPLQSQALA